MDDRERVAQYLAGEPSAVAEVESWIVERIRLGYPYQASIAEDLQQEIHRKLVFNLRARRFLFNASLRTYVHRITDYTTIDAIQRQKRERSWRPQGKIGTAVDPETALQQLEHDRSVRKAVLASSDECRELWRLVFGEKLGYRQIATLLGIPEGTVKSRMWHCRKRLQKALADLEHFRSDE